MLRNLFVLTVLSAVFVYFIHDPLPPEEYSQAWFLRIQLATLKMFRRMLEVAHFFGYKDAPIFYRSIYDAVGSVLRPPPDPSVERVADFFDGVEIRLYRPKDMESSGTLRGVVYLHGGGFVFADIDSHDEQVSTITKRLGVIAISVSYRLAPEHVFPAAVDDCEKATIYFVNNAKTFGVDPTRIAIMGDSAGGNLAAAVSIRLRNKQFKPMPKLQVLIYPVLQTLNLHTPSHQANYDGPFVSVWLASFFNSVYLFGKSYRNYIDLFYNDNITTTAIKKSIRNTYMNTDVLPKDNIMKNYNENIGHNNPQIWEKVQHKIMDPDFSVLFAKNLTGVPAAYISTCQYDHIRDDGFFYAHRLREAKVSVKHDNLRVCFHGWAFSHKIVDVFKVEYENIMKFMDTNF